jgi:hypothetical protein
MVTYACSSVAWEEYIWEVESILGIILGIALLTALLVALTRRRSRRFQLPPGRWGYPGRSGDREPRHPLVPAGSAAATVEEPHFRNDPEP